MDFFFDESAGGANHIPRVGGSFKSHSQFTIHQPILTKGSAKHLINEGQGQHAMCNNSAELGRGSEFPIKMDRIEITGSLCVIFYLILSYLFVYRCDINIIIIVANQYDTSLSVDSL